MDGTAQHCEGVVLVANHKPQLVELTILCKIKSAGATVVLVNFILFLLLVLNTFPSLIAVVSTPPCMHTHGIAHYINSAFDFLFPFVAAFAVKNKKSRVR